jgi:hypothetical protein
MTALTPRQQKMLLESEPLGWTDGCGVELWTPQDYAVARSLQAKGLGSWEQGPKGSCGLYFNNADGVELRAEILGEDDEEDSWEALDDLAFEEMCRKLP